MARDGSDTRTLDVLNMQQQSGSFITVVQADLGAVTTLVDIVGEAAVRPYFDGLLVNTDSWGSTAASLLTFALVTGGFILIADLMSKCVAIARPEAVAVRIVRPMMFLISILKPSVWTFGELMNTISKLFKISTVRQEQLTSEDIYVVVDAGTQAGVSKQRERCLIEDIFDIQAYTVTSTMSTREYIAYSDKNDGSDTMLEIMSEKPYNKSLVYDDDLERVIGYIESRTLLTPFLKEKDVRLTDKRVLHRALLIPDTLSLYNVLETFKTSDKNSVAVVNEYALVVGVVTLRDVTSIVMGELVNTEKELQIIRRTENTWLVDDATPLVDIMRALDIEEFPNPESYETIADFMMYSLCKIPKRTDFLIYAGYKSEIINTGNPKTDRLLATRQGNGPRTDGSGLPAQV